MRGSGNLTLRDYLVTGEGNRLTLHGVDLVDLCSKYGTPLFVFDEKSLVENFERFRGAFENVYSKIMVCYSIKTNNNLAICKILRERGAYAEVASELDLYVAKKAGFSGDHVIYDGPYKPRDALRKALEEEVLLINVESFSEMERFNQIAGKMGVKQAIGLRISPFRRRSFSAYTSLSGLIEAAYCNHGCRFGFPLEDAYSAFKRAVKLENLSVEGIITHPYRGAANTLLPIVREVHERLGIEVKYLDLGGGFYSGATRFVGSKELIWDLLRQKVGFKSKLNEGQSIVEIESVAKSVIDKVRQNLGGLPEPTIVVEPGRFIVASAGALLVRVDHVKSAGGFKWVMVDGGTNLVPHSFGYMEFHDVMSANKASGSQEELVNVVGPLLYSEDIVTLKARLPNVSEGDILLVFGCGAYTLSKSTQFLHPRPPAVLLDSKGEVRVIREKETFEDVLDKDKDV